MASLHSDSPVSSLFRIDQRNQSAVGLRTQHRSRHSGLRNFERCRSFVPSQGTPRQMDPKNFVFLHHPYAGHELLISIGIIHLLIILGVCLILLFRCGRREWRARPVSLIQLPGSPPRQADTFDPFPLPNHTAHCDCHDGFGLTCRLLGTIHKSGFLTTQAFMIAFCTNFDAHGRMTR